MALVAPATGAIYFDNGSERSIDNCGACTANCRRTLEAKNQKSDFPVNRQVEEKSIRIARDRLAACDTRDDLAEGLIGKLGLRIDKITSGLRRWLLRRTCLGDLDGVRVDFHLGVSKVVRVSGGERKAVGSSSERSSPQRENWEASAMPA